MDVRFTPKSRHRLSALECLLSAKSGLLHCSKRDCYSISSSARASMVPGMVRPSALADLRLTTSSFGRLLDREFARSRAL
jgi:hypothetical protein